MNWKKIWFGILVIGLPLTMLAASIRWYNDAGIPQKTTMAGTEIVSLQQTGPNAYRWALLSDVRTYMGGTSGDPIVNIYSTTINVTTNYITNGFITYLTVLSNAYFFETNFVNYEITTNLTVINQTTIGRLIVNSNATFYNTSYFNYQITTNLTVIESLTVQSNLTVNQTINTRNLNVTSNIYYLSATPQDVTWAGPTNTGDFRLGSRQSYVTYTPVALTNLIGDTNGYINSLMLTFSNAASTNIQFWAPTNLVKLAEGESNPFTVSNATRFKFWMEKSGQGYDAVSRRWQP